MYIVFPFLFSREGEPRRAARRSEHGHSSGMLVSGGDEWKTAYSAVFNSTTCAPVRLEIDESRKWSFRQDGNYGKMSGRIAGLFAAGDLGTVTEVRPGTILLGHENGVVEAGGEGGDGGGVETDTE